MLLGPARGLGIVAAVSGFATNRRDLTDDMYADAAAHEPDGA
ncbi:hypothetical protein QP614_06760 [Corynebacterium striatum]|nr:hypothetical protein [Corynebacterium striatum]